MQEVYERVRKWNAARYPRVYVQALSMALLREEYQEWLDAKDDVDRLDALCDITFVAMGCIWKLDVTDAQNCEAAENAFTIMDNMIDGFELNTAFLIPCYLDVAVHVKDYPQLQTMHNIVVACMGQMLSMGLSEDQIEQALIAVCKSNESKTIVKTEPGVKANIDKGPFYMSPTMDLECILAGVKNELN